MSEFYVGYLPKAPPQLSRTIRWIALGLIALGGIIAVLLVLGQSPFPASAFEFQKYREYEGIVREHPYPNLVVSLPGADVSTYLLVAPGKHGAADLIRSFDGRAVRVS